MPKLVCDRPNPAENISYYTIAGLPGNPTTPLSDNGSFGIEYDISDLPPGEYTVRVSACNEWQCSLPAPLDFTALPVPSLPTGLRIFVG